MTSVTEINLMYGVPNGTHDRAIAMLAQHGELSSAEMMALGISRTNFPKVIALLCALKEVEVRTTGQDIGVITKYYRLKGA